MIQIFGLLFFIILICLIYLYYQGKISRNIPIIFMFFLILIIPFTYLETNKTNVESYSDYNQIMNSSLDIFYTNQKSKRREMNELKKVKLIDNPIQTILVQKDIKPINLSIYVKYYTPYIGFWITAKSQYIPIYFNYGNQNVITYITNDDLYKEDYDSIKTRVTVYSDLDILNTTILGVPSESYILIFGNNITPFKDAVSATKRNFIDTFKFSWLNNLSSSSSSSGSFIVLLSKSDNSYTKISEKFTSDSNSYATISQNLISDSVYFKSNGGVEFKKVANNDVFIEISGNNLINSKMNIISPDISNSDYALSFTSENNESFVYLSSRKLENEVVLYAKSPKNDIGPTSTTYLDTQRPQLWSFEPVTQIVTEPLIVFIRTYSKPYYYLDAEFENGVIVLKAKRFKAALRQHWELLKEGPSGTKYKIRHLKSEMYLAYSDYDGYLYKEDGSVFLTKSERYIWNISSINSNNPNLNKNVIENFTPKSINSFQAMEVPTDYGSVANPSWKISGNVKGKDIVIESKGRTVWDANYSPIWSGKWIYYGTVNSYKATLDINRVQFLIIKIDANGNGQVEDEHLNYKMDVINAGANILTGIIPSGEYKGFRATLKLLPTDLKYADPSKPYPVKMRYFIEKDNKRMNLSSGNIYNMQGYSTKFLGDKLILSNFLEASGIQTDPNLAFSSNDLQNINVSIKEQIDVSPNIKLANKYMKNPIKSSKLLYKASRHGWNYGTFHQLADNKGATISIATLQDGRIIGAYSPISWETTYGYVNNTEVFLFDSDNKYTTSNSYYGPGTYAIYQSASYGPTFGGGHDFLSLPSWNPSLLYTNAYTFINNNGKSPLGVNQTANNQYQLKDFEVYSIIVDPNRIQNQANLMLKVAGINDVPSNCARGDYKCQAKDICEKVTGETCLHQTYECKTGSTGSWYPSGTPGGSTFNFAYGYDAGANEYGNICSCERSYMTKYGLAANNTYCGLGNWTRQ